MKKVYKSQEIENALKKKGFVELDSHHKKFFLYVNGRKTCVNTKLSHSFRDVPIPIIRVVIKQMGFNNNKEFQDYVECHMSKEEYIRLLRKNGTID